MRFIKNESSITFEFNKPNFSKSRTLALLLTFVMLFTFSFYAYPVHAQDLQDCDINYDGSQAGDSTIHIPVIFCVVNQAINIILYVAGGVLLLMIAMAIYKFATSMGDPKAVMGARSTLTHTLLGFAFVVGVWVILNVMGGLFGVRNEGADNYTNTGVMATAQRSVCDLLWNAGTPLVCPVRGCVWGDTQAQCDQYYGN